MTLSAAYEFSKFNFVQNCTNSATIMIYQIDFYRITSHEYTLCSDTDRPHGITHWMGATTATVAAVAAAVASEAVHHSYMRKHIAYTAYICAERVFCNFYGCRIEWKLTAWKHFLWNPFMRLLVAGRFWFYSIFIISYSLFFHSALRSE